MPTVTLTRATDTRADIKVTDNEGRVLLRLKASPIAQATVKKVKQAARISEAQWFARVDEFEQTETGVLEFKTGGDAISTAPFSVRVRPLRAPADHAKTYTAESPPAALRDAIESPPPIGGDPVIQWDDGERLAVLDVDYHGVPYDDRPTVDRLNDLARRVQPRPVHAHTSHGRGAKLYYGALAGFTADELAAVAGLQWRELDGRATFEVKRESRHPGAPRVRDGRTETCSPILSGGTGTADLAAVGRWLGRSADPDAVAEWAAVHNTHLGGRLPHSLCPIAPHLPTTGQDPVWVNESGLYCHKCAGEGRAYNRFHAPGVVSWPAVVGGLSSKVYGLVANCVHWCHARHCLAHYVGGAADRVMRLAYRAALKLVHGDGDPRIPLVFGPDRGFVLLVGGQWYLGDGRTACVRDSQRRIVAELPVAFKCERDPDTRRVTAITPHEGNVGELINGGIDLARLGYYPLSPVRAVKVWGEFLEYDTQTDVPYLQPNDKIDPQLAPRYVPPARRMDVEAAWKVVEGYFPGVNRRYVELLVAAKGFAEAGRETPKVLVAGPSGSGKSLHTDVAASIVGQKSAEIVWTAETTRLRAAIKTATDSTDYVRVDEIFKEAHRARQNSVQALDPFLTIEKDSVSHSLYVGPVRMGKNFVLICTDIQVPDDAARDLQLGRRFVYVRLAHRVDWRTSCQAKGVAHVADWRSAGREAADAADAILSDVIDRFFRSPRTFEQVAAALGFDPLERSADHDDRTDALKRFFKAVCDAPPLKDGDKRKYPGPGWKKILRDAAPDDELSQVYQELCDDLAANWSKSRRCAEVDWCQVLGLSVLQDVRYESKPQTSGGVIYVRFHVGEGTKNARYNADILNPPGG